MMKLFIRILIVIIGIILFRLSFRVIDQVRSSEVITISEDSFYDLEIFIKNRNKTTKITGNDLFNKIPNLDIYPNDSIIYFKIVETQFTEGHAKIATITIQNSSALFKTTFYFNLINRVELEKIHNIEFSTGSELSIKDDSEIDSFLKTYKGFIDLLILYNAEK